MECDVIVAVDAMSGDQGPAVVVPAVISIVRNHPDVSCILVGDQQQLGILLEGQTVPRIKVVHAPEVVHMGDKPSHALRKKQHSSMAVALRLVKEAQAQACVSAGNTGALMVLGRSILRTHPGIDRPAIVKLIPSFVSRCYVLDLGANVDCSAEHLVQFALMGSALAEVLEEKADPRVALLNVGEEDIKGNEQVRLASRMLAEGDLINYVGYVEGGDIFNAVTDVVICDGFVGNVALKAGESVAEIIVSMLRQAFSGSWYGRFVGLLAKPLLKKIRVILDPPRHNGASLIGLQATVVKSHGSADARGIYSAIEQAIYEARKRVPEMINARLDKLT